MCRLTPSLCVVRVCLFFSLTQLIGAPGSTLSCFARPRGTEYYVKLTLSSRLCELAAPATGLRRGRDWESALSGRIPACLARRRRNRLGGRGAKTRSRAKIYIYIYIGCNTRPPFGECGIPLIIVAQAGMPQINGYVASEGDFLPLTTIKRLGPFRNRCGMFIFARPRGCLRTHRSGRTSHITAT